jgi:hypothetical protein
MWPAETVWHEEQAGSGDGAANAPPPYAPWQDTQVRPACPPASGWSAFGAGELAPSQAPEAWQRAQPSSACPSGVSFAWQDSHARGSGLNPFAWHWLHKSPAWPSASGNAFGSTV